MIVDATTKMAITGTRHYPRRLFERKPDGSYIYGADASPVLIRCIAHHDGWFEHVDGGGDVHRYRLVPLPAEPGD